MFRVRSLFLVWLLLTGVAYCEKVNSQAQWQPKDGVYVALERMPNISPEDPMAEWFHENSLLVRHNETILDMVPVWIKGGKKHYSASDGGFRTYRARFFQRDGKPFINLRLFQSDYVMLPANKESI